MMLALSLVIQDISLEIRSSLFKNNETKANLSGLLLKFLAILAMNCYSKCLFLFSLLRSLNLFNLTFNLSLPPPCVYVWLGLNV